MRSYVNVRFKKTDTKTYTYVTDGVVEELSKFTHAVVESPYGAFTVVEVIKFDTLDENTYDGAYKDVITLFNLERYNEKLKNGQRKAALKKKLRRRVAKLLAEFRSL